MINTRTYSEGLWYPGIRADDDLALWRARGTLEVLEGRGAALFHWDDHYERLLASCRGGYGVSVNALPSKDDFERKIVDVINSCGYRSALVYILVSEGDSDDLKKPKGSPKVYLNIKPFPIGSLKPFKLRTISTKREFPEYKTTPGYGYAGLHEKEAQPIGYDKFIYRDSLEGILEGAYENIFFVTKGPCARLITPRNGVLFGVTRKIVLNLACRSDVFAGGVVEASYIIYPHNLQDCAEAFLTSTTLGVAEVVSIDGYPFETGPNTLTRKLQRLFAEYRKRYYKERGA